MAGEASERAPLETGGMLLGYISDEGDPPEAVIEQVIPPGPNALHGRARFMPDGRWQRQRMLRVFTRSNGVTTYLGDWHSHPSGGPAPSALDIKTARKIARRRRSRTQHPLMTILYGSERHWHVATHCYDGTSLRAVSVREF